METLQLYITGITTALKGVPITVGVSLVAVFCGILLGLLLALMKASKFKFLVWPSSVYIELVRGTPLVVQALLLAYGIPQLVQSWGVDFKWPFLIIPATIACGLNSAAYAAEVIRSGLQAVDKGQMEAARSLGMSKGMAMRLIIIPQAFRIILPAVGNEFITLIKETAVLSYVGVVEILRRGVLWNASAFQTFPAYIGVAIVYLILTIPLSRLVAYLERRMASSDRS